MSSFLTLSIFRCNSDLASSIFFCRSTLWLTEGPGLLDEDVPFALAAVPEPGAGGVLGAGVVIAELAGGAVGAAVVVPAAVGAPELPDEAGAAVEVLPLAAVAVLGPAGPVPEAVPPVGPDPDDGVGGVPLDPGVTLPGPEVAPTGLPMTEYCSVRLLAAARFWLPLDPVLLERLESEAVNTIPFGPATKPLGSVTVIVSPSGFFTVMV